ncbi:uncharacterized protein LOC132755677 [Ruditapes philippinarum]|uniref:uncharacterized protein LOC132755677 n=1 Tax=Ruditapes philippinarum TaxID=129788 RepID=UPI00295B5B59|nr:uncharacterized protein LOC132755677 [Ruditapes philippinarum]
MTEYAFLVLIVLMKTLVSFTEGDASSLISCNMELLTWQEAFDTCKSKGGYMLPFETGLGQNIDKLTLKMETDVWTADYLTPAHYLRPADDKNVKYCGFHYLNSTSYETKEVFYGDCKANRNYFCKTEQDFSWVLVVYNSTREKVYCNYIVWTSDLKNMRSIIKPGYYWNHRTLLGKARVARKDADYIIMPDTLCGAYKSSIGMYYANCKEKRISLCSRNGNERMNNICFDGYTTKVNEHATIVTRTQQNVTVITKTTAKSVTNSQERTDYKSDTPTKQPMTVLTSVKDKENLQMTHPQDKEQSSDIGIKVGVPLGIILPLTCGVLIAIYIFRKRIQCWQSSKPTHEHGRMNQLHTQKTSPVHGHLNVNFEYIQDTSISSEHHTNENNLTDISSQYAVVKKPKTGDSKSRQENYSNKSYQNATYDEYDVAGRFQNSRSNQSDNLYNHLESVDEYNSTSFVREGECNNLYNTTGDRNLVESDYDSTTQVNNTTLPDDVYNHLSQGDNYYDSTSTTRNK